jgi:glycosyltransferase involved in cell wall biosynthesis
MRILILHSRYRSGPVSGENRVVDDEARLLTEGGHEVRVFAPTLGRPSGRELVAAAAGTMWSASAASRVRSLVRAFRPDVVHCHNLFPGLSPAVLRATDDVPLAMTLHNYRLHCLPATYHRDGRPCRDCVGRTPWPGVAHRCYQSTSAASAVLAGSLVLHRAIGTFDMIDRFVAISGFVRQAHVEAGIAPGRIAVKPHFVWPSRPRSGAGDHFLYLGRLTPEKGVASLLEAWRGIDAPLVVAGDGPEAPRLRATAPASVRFVGPVAPDRVDALLRGARALLVPSLWEEPAGRVVLEAYAAAVPVVVSPMGGLPELVLHEETGLIVPAGDVEAWAAGVERLREDEESTRMGEAGRRFWTGAHTPEHGLRALEGLYAEMGAAAPDRRSARRAS